MSQAVLLLVSLLALPAFAMPTIEKLANGVTFIVVPGPGEPALVTVTIPKAGTPSPIDLAALMAATIAPSIPQRTSVDRVIFRPDRPDPTGGSSQKGRKGAPDGDEVRRHELA